MYTKEDMVKIVWFDNSSATRDIKTTKLISNIASNKSFKKAEKKTKQNKPSFADFRSLNAENTCDLILWKLHWYHEHVS